MEPIKPMITKPALFSLKKYWTIPLISPQRFKTKMIRTINGTKTINGLQWSINSVFPCTML